MAFDIASARKSGYNDDEIRDYLGNYFDVMGAEDAGYSLNEIAAGVGQHQQAKEPPALGVPTTMTAAPETPAPPTPPYFPYTTGGMAALRDYEGKDVSQLPKPPTYEEQLAKQTRAPAESAAATAPIAFTPSPTKKIAVGLPKNIAKPSQIYEVPSNLKISPTQLSEEGSQPQVMGPPAPPKKRYPGTDLEAMFNSLPKAKQLPWYQKLTDENRKELDAYMTAKAGPRAEADVQPGEGAVYPWSSATIGELGKPGSYQPTLATPMGETPTEAIGAGLKVAWKGTMKMLAGKGEFLAKLMPLEDAIGETFGGGERQTDVERTDLPKQTPQVDAVAAAQAKPTKIGVPKDYRTVVNPQETPYLAQVFKDAGKEWELTDRDKEDFQKAGIIGEVANLVGSLALSTPDLIIAGGLVGAPLKAGMAALVSSKGTQYVLSKIPRFVEQYGKDQAIAKYIDKLTEMADKNRVFTGGTEEATIGGGGFATKVNRYVTGAEQQAAYTGVKRDAIKQGIDALLQKEGRDAVLEQIPTAVRIFGKDAAIPKLTQMASDAGGFGAFGAAAKMVENVQSGKRPTEGVAGAALENSLMALGGFIGATTGRVATEGMKPITRLGAEAIGAGIGAGATALAGQEATGKDALMMGLQFAVMHTVGGLPQAKAEQNSNFEKVRQSVREGIWQHFKNGGSFKNDVTGETFTVRPIETPREGIKTEFTKFVTLNRFAKWFRNQEGVSVVNPPYTPVYRRIGEAGTPPSEGETPGGPTIPPGPGTPPTPPEGPSERTKTLADFQVANPEDFHKLPEEQRNAIFPQLSDAEQARVAEAEPVERAMGKGAEGGATAPSAEEAAAATAIGRRKESRRSLQIVANEIQNEWKAKGIEGSPEAALSAADRASRHPVTGLRGKAHKVSAIDRIMADKTPGTTPIFVSQDIDFFKPFNDTFSHEVGDQVLQQVMPAVNKLYRRVGLEHFHESGDENSAMGRVADADIPGLYQKLLQVKKDIDEIKIDLPNGKTVPLSMTVSISTNPEMSDKLLSDAKKTNRNGITLDNELKQRYTLEDRQGKNLKDTYLAAGLLGRGLTDEQAKAESAGLPTPVHRHGERGEELQPGRPDEETAPGSAGRGGVDATVGAPPAEDATTAQPAAAPEGPELKTVQGVTTPTPTTPVSPTPSGTGVSVSPDKSWEQGQYLQGLTEFNPNSTKNEGRIRLSHPDEFDRDAFTSKGKVTPFIHRPKMNGLSADGISFIVGKRNGKQEIQAIRFNKKKWPEAAATDWVKQNAEALGRPELAKPPSEGRKGTTGSPTAKTVEVLGKKQVVETEPTPDQVDAGNYKKGHVTVDGMDVSIENPAGEVRRSKQVAKKTWAIQVNHHYGYFTGTRSTDGKDHVDVFVNPGYTGGGENAYIVNQVNPKTRTYDEPKVMLGFKRRGEARAAYFSNYEPGWQGLHSIVEVPMDKFKEWLYSTKPSEKHIWKQSDFETVPRPAAGAGPGTTVVPAEPVTKEPVSGKEAEEGQAEAAHVPVVGAEGKVTTPVPGEPGPETLDNGFTGIVKSFHAPLDLTFTDDFLAKTGTQQRAAIAKEIGAINKRLKALDTDPTQHLVGTDRAHLEILGRRLRKMMRSTPERKKALQNQVIKRNEAVVEKAKKNVVTSEQDREIQASIKEIVGRLNANEINAFLVANHPDDKIKAAVKAIEEERGDGKAAEDIREQFARALVQGGNPGDVIEYAKHAAGPQLNESGELVDPETGEVLFAKEKEEKGDKGGVRKGETGKGLRAASERDLQKQRFPNTQSSGMVRRSVLSLNRAIDRMSRKRLGRELQDGAITAIPMPVSEEQILGHAIGRGLFHRNTIPIHITKDARDAAGGDWGAVILPSDPGTVFITDTVTKSPIISAVHECLHAMQAEAPDLYKIVVDTMIEEGTDGFEQYKNDLKDLYPEDQVLNESVCEIAGEMFTDDSFLQKLWERSPDAFKNFVANLRDAMKRLRLWLMRQNLSNKAAMFRDLARVERTLADAVVRFSGRERGKVERAAGEVGFAKEKEEKSAPKKPKYATGDLFAGTEHADTRTEAEKERDLKSQQEASEVRYRQSLTKGGRADTEGLALFGNSQQELVLFQKQGTSEDAIRSFFEDRDGISENVIAEFDKNADNPKARQRWDVIPAGRLKKIWGDYARVGVVRDERSLDNMVDIIKQNTHKLYVNSLLMGHTPEDPGNFIDRIYESGDSESLAQKIDKTDFFTDDHGSWRLSDNALARLDSITAQLYDPKTPEEKLLLVDQALNIAHMRSDLASWFVEGGSKTLSELAEARFEKEGASLEQTKKSTHEKSTEKPAPEEPGRIGTNVVRGGLGEKAIADLTKAVTRYATNPEDPISFVLEEPSTEEHRVAARVANEFGTRIVFFSYPPETKRAVGFGINGVHLRGVPGYENAVFLNVKATTPIVQVMGHELTHVLKTKYPDLWQDYHRVAWEQLTEEGHRIAQEEGIEEPGADFIGEQLMDKNFWDRLWEYSEQAARAAIRELLRVVDRVLNVLGRIPKGTSTGYFKDVKKVRDKAARVLAEFRRREAAGEKGGVLTAENRTRFQMQAYHGSPHRFDKFEMRPRTGEGEMAFGHGLYFTSEKAIADHYAQKLGNPLKDAQDKWGKAYESASFVKDDKTRGDIQDKLRRSRELIDQAARMPSSEHSEDKLNQAHQLADEASSLAEKKADKDTSHFLEAFDEYEEVLRRLHKENLKGGGQTYAVTLHKGKTLDQYDYLKWDEPIGKSQEEKVIAEVKMQWKQEPNKKVLGYHSDEIDQLRERLFGDRYKVIGGVQPSWNMSRKDAESYQKKWGGKISPENTTGQMLYRGIAMVLGADDQAASDFLLRAGIDGIDYPAGTLSNATSGARNFVVFDPEAVTIDEVAQFQKARKSVLDQLTTPQKDYEDVQVVGVPVRGFLLPDGRYLDIGGQDHRYVNGMVDLGKKLEDRFNTESGGRSHKMFYLMKAAGTIRFIPESKVFQIVTRPTDEQVGEIERFIKENGTAEIEMGENAPSKTYTEENLYELEEDLREGQPQFQKQPAHLAEVQRHINEGKEIEENCLKVGQPFSIA